MAMTGIVLTFPILSGKVEAWRHFCQELSGSRQEMHESSRRQLGITRERLALMETPYGASAVTTLEAQNVGEALNQMAISDDTFDLWYREQMLELYGVNLARYDQYLSRATARQTPVEYFNWREEA